MAKINYTRAQQRAIYYPDGDLLLSAAAGSGKTAALTGRIVQLIIEGRAELSEMLIVTFTKAAAGEMRGRITKLLREKMEEYSRTDAQIMSRLSAAMTQVSSAQISTIHSFLYSMLAPYFPTLGLTQDAVIADEKEIEQIKAEIMRDVVDDFFKKDEKTTNNDQKSRKINFILLADTIGQARDQGALDAELLWLSEKLEGMGADHSMLESCAVELETTEANSVGIFETRYGKMVISDIEEFTFHYQKLFRCIAEEFENEPKITEKYGPALQSILDWLDETERELSTENIDFSLLKSHFNDYSPKKLERLSKKDSTETAEIFKKFREDLKKEIGKYSSYYFSADEDEFKASAHLTAEILHSAAAVLEEYEKRLDNKKHAMSVLEYGDLEKYATRLLLDESKKPTDEAREIGARYKYIFVDEYQDTNRVQDDIFCAISENSVRFMVGDIKQSIYRFRGADPRVFAGYRKIWEKDQSEEYTEECINIGKSIFMSENFRSSREIISFVNSVSAEVLPHGGIPYESEDELIFARDGNDPKVPVEVTLIEKTKTEEESEEKSKNIKENPEAIYVAKRIKSMIGRYTEDGTKIIEPSDIAVLLRSPNLNGADYRKALEDLGIAVDAKNSKTLRENSSILLLVSLLKFIENPLRDIYAAGTMMSPIFDFTIDEIVKLRKLAGEMPIYTGVAEICSEIWNEENELYQKCEKLTNFLREEKLICDTISPEKYLENLLEKTEFYHIPEIRNNAGERDAIRKVLSLAKEFENKNRSGSASRNLYGFVEYLDELLDEETESGNGEKTDAVSIMSIHASKGLEFPVCFICETSKRRNTKEESRTMLFDDEMGFGMYLPDSTGLIKCDNLIRRTISKKIASDSEQEEMRMLYVALTRARGKLIVTAKTKSAEETLADAQARAEFSDGYSVKKAESYIEWILGGIIKKQHSEDWKILSVDAKNIQSDEYIDESIDEEECDYEKVDEIIKEIKPRFDFKYKYEFLEHIPSKLVVSRLSPEILDEDSASETSDIIDKKAKIVQLTFDELTGQLSEEEADEKLQSLKKPQFMLGQKHASANEIGSATHRFLQFVDFTALNRDGLDSEIGRLREQKFISENDTKVINIRELRRFMQSSLFDSLIRSDFVKREFRFNVLMDAHEFTEDSELKEKLRENDVKITVQGVVDCVFRDPDSGKLILIDYKTDSIKPDEWKNQKKAEERLRERHKHQLSYYRRICSEMFEEEITEVYIYSTPLGKCVKI